MKERAAVFGSAGLFCGHQAPLGGSWPVLAASSFGWTDLLDGLMDTTRSTLAWLQFGQNDLMQRPFLKEISRRGRWTNLASGSSVPLL